MATKGMGRTIGAANVKIMPDTKGFAQRFGTPLNELLTNSTEFLKLMLKPAYI